MIQISDVVIISIDKSEDSWAVEGEILFEPDLASAFSVTYLTMEDELEDLEIEIIPGKYDTRQLKEKILRAAVEYED